MLLDVVYTSRSRHTVPFSYTQVDTSFLNRGGILVLLRGKSEFLVSLKDYLCRESFPAKKGHILGLFKKKLSKIVP